MGDDEHDEEGPRLPLTAYLERRGVPPGIRQGLLHRRTAYKGANQVFAPNERDRALAWSIVVELSSRIATQPVGRQVGDEASGAASVARLYQTLRQQAIAAGPAGSSTARLAIWMLNGHLREYTARWHGLAEKGLLARGDHARRFRTDLETLQGTMRLWCEVFALIAEDRHWEFDEYELIEPPTPTATCTARPNGCDFVRAELGVPGQGCLPDFTSGLALSGGGIRSASFGLGVLQGMARESSAGSSRQSRSFRVLDEVDYVSTVSGGGYLGTLIATTHHCDEASKGGQDTNGEPDHPPTKDDPLSEEVEAHVRQHAAAMEAEALSSLMFPWAVGATVTLLPLAATVVLAAIAMDVLNQLDCTNMIIAAFGIVGFCLVLLTGLPQRTPAHRFVHPGRITRVRLGVLLMGAATVLAALSVADRGFEMLGVHLDTHRAALASTTTAISAGTAAFVLRRIGPHVLLLPLLLISVVAAAAALLPVLESSFELEALPFAIHYSAIALPFTGVAFLVLGLFDANSLTPRSHYQERLRATWIRKEPLAAEPLAVFAPPRGAEAKKRPVHLWNLSLNLPADTGVRKKLHGRTGTLLTLSPFGADWVDPERNPRHAPWSEDTKLSIQDAMALSGAAVSPMRGDATTTATRIWLTLLNARMGAWIPNPFTQSKGLRGVLKRPPGWLILRELLGWVNHTGPWIHVSDGGHVENLGVLPLLRRRCRFIVAIDGECDPTHTFDGLWRLQLRAKLDLGADLDIDTTDLELDALGRSNSHAIAVPITYEDGETGVMIYVKLSLTGDEDQHIAGYRSTHPSFPHESTADQVYDEAQFEAYRALGEHIGRHLTSDETGVCSSIQSLDDWCMTLFRHMRDDGAGTPWQVGGKGCTGDRAPAGAVGS